MVVKRSRKKRDGRGMSFGERMAERRGGAAVVQGKRGGERESVSRLEDGTSGKTLRTRGYTSTGDRSTAAKKSGSRLRRAPQIELAAERRPSSSTPPPPRRHRHRLTRLNCGLSTLCNSFLMMLNFMPVSVLNTELERASPG